ncbi:hypothetical protein SAE02_28050 [Skermanella aerolata]|uniref:Uncharacterized protein n=3 Tax=Skermanella aerolata TaxID=393310 RepID=A0A512DQA9_9PROT|nr:hypothetical protein N826_17580 [Skermanella aerolata KACC 11604]GEO38657.1 hypothetical protein SAE02_28050 [Skermanella aerolata]
MAYAPGWRAVMNEYVTAMLDLLIGLVSEVPLSHRLFKGAPDVPPKSANAKWDSNAQGERIASIEGRLNEQSRILEALIHTRSVA